MATTEQMDEIQAMYNAGFSADKIAHELSLAPNTVRGIMKDMGLSIRTPGKETMPTEVVSAIIKAYQDEIPVPEILHEYGVSYTKLYTLLADNEIPLRRIAQAPARHIQMEQAIQMYKDGATLAHIFAETGIHQPQLHAEIAIQGIPLRRPRK